MPRPFPNGRRRRLNLLQIAGKVLVRSFDSLQKVEEGSQGGRFDSLQPMTVTGLRLQLFETLLAHQLLERQNHGLRLRLEAQSLASSSRSSSGMSRVVSMKNRVGCAHPAVKREVAIRRDWRSRTEAELATLLDKDLAALNATAAQRGYPAVWVGGR